MSAIDKYDEAVRQSGRLTARRTTREWAVRLVLMVFALSLGQFGVTLFILPALGADPYTAFAQGVAGKLAISVGIAHASLTIAIMVALWFVARKYDLPGTVVCSFFAGPFIDVYHWLLGGCIGPASPIWLRVVVVVLGTILIAAGYALLIKADGGLGAADLLPIIISDRFRFQYRWAKMGLDVFLAVTGSLLGGVIGIGTVIAVFLVGPVAQALFPLMERIVRTAVRKFARR
ncbi:MAG: hypothetical protein LUC93_06060 [Planctomycetaceae bacterium]|nr:hypothetical protein [Planctomycetaceae bacterium]